MPATPIQRLACACRSLWRRLFSRSPAAPTLDPGMDLNDMSRDAMRQAMDDLGNELRRRLAQ